MNDTTLIAKALLNLANLVNNKASKLELQTAITGLQTQIGNIVENGTENADLVAQLKEYTDNAIAALVDDAPEAYNTLKKLAEALENDESGLGAIIQQLGTKASSADLQAHVSDADIHVTKADKEAWNAKADKADVEISDTTIKALITTLAGEDDVEE